MLEPTVPNPKATVCGVEIATWGTHPNGGNGLAHFIDSNLFGGSVGHASVSVTFPADEKGKELIKKYCSSPVIPYEKRKISIPKAKQVEGKFTASDEPAFEEEVYVVHFSWFPGSNGFFLKESLSDDNLKEREGVNVEWDPKWKEYIQPEERYHGGILAGSKMTYAPYNIVHSRNLDENHQKVLNYKAESLILKNQLRSLNVLEDKINNKEFPKQKNISEASFSETEKMLLNKFIPEWKESASIDIILEKISHKKSIINSSIEDFRKQIYRIDTSHNIEDPEKLDDFEKAQDIYDNWNYANDILLGLADPRSKDYVKPGENIPLTKINDSTLDDAFKQVGINWKEYLSSNEIITHEEIAQLFEISQFNLVKSKHDVVDLEMPLNMFAQGNYNNYYTQGLSPDDLIRLPLADEKHPGMNVESMLKKMKNIAEHSSFDLEKHNCSYTVSKILEAGAENEHLKMQFRNRALNCIANPQIVSNNARDYLNELHTNPHPADTLASKIKNFNPIERLGGWCIDKLYVSPSAKLPEKILAGILIAPVSTYCAIKEGIKKMLHPMKSFNELQNFANYANSHQHTGFKIAAAIGYIPGMIITAPLAGVEYAAKSVMKMIFPTKPKNTEETIDVPHAEKSKKEIIKDLDNIFNHLQDLNNAIKQKESPEKINALKEKIKNELAEVKDSKIYKDNRNATILLNTDKAQIMLNKLSNKAIQRTDKHVKKAKAITHTELSSQSPLSSQPPKLDTHTSLKGKFKK